MTIFLSSPHNSLNWTASVPPSADSRLFSPAKRPHQTSPSQKEAVVWPAPHPPLVFLSSPHSSLNWTASVPPSAERSPRFQLLLPCHHTRRPAPSSPSPV
ncbi:hypothetical protein POPTR_019G059350v4 [Populus trichocarpa]|uniref:Uncharacterized protein n=1 Tax=Populus trichocarpa TaxID=3694 RepID=A0ACC0RKG5_POPTR|nr:hypothetical protein POPTR_019G059350v4 [Populus trichocarpa]